MINIEIQKQIQRSSSGRLTTNSAAVKDVFFVTKMSPIPIFAPNLCFPTFKKICILGPSGQSGVTSGEVKDGVEQADRGVKK